MAKLELQGITKRFRGPEGEITAVDDIDLTVEDGEFLVLVGPSGCGKSTTLRMIAGLESVNEGRIYADGEDITDRKPRNRDVAMVFQNYALYPHKTVRGNISYSLEKSRELSRDEIDQKVDDVIELLEIEGLGEKKPDQLSGGQKQRVALGRAIVRDPDIFLMDEPLSNLDAKLRMNMRTEIQYIQSRFGTTTVYVTHDQEEAMSMSDSIAVMRDGKIQQHGDPDEIYERPTNEFVARFIGSPSMNFFGVTVDGARVVGDHFDIEYSKDLQELTSGEYLLGVRPEDIQLERGTQTGDTAEVEVVEPIGSDSIVYLDLAGSEVRVTVPRAETPDEGETVALTIPERATHFFDPDTGEAVAYGSTLEDDVEVASETHRDQQSATESS